MLLDLIKVAVGDSHGLSFSPTNKQWSDAFDAALQHGIFGLFYAAINKLPSEQQPKEQTLRLKCFVIEDKLINSNDELDRVCAKVTKNFETEGFDSCILKGQGLSLLYPKEIVRSTGDIDIWVSPKNSKLPLKERRRQIYEYCKTVIPSCRAVYHHCQFPVFRQNVEVHFTPSWFFSPFKNRKVQAYFESQWKNRYKTEKGFYVLSIETNLVYILIHNYRHLFHEGIELKHVLDYYYVLKKAYEDGLSNKGENEYKIEAIEIFKSLGMMRFVAAMMWVQKFTFGLNDKYLLCIPNEKEGRFLFNEIMMNHTCSKYDSLSATQTVQDSLILIGYRKCKRLLHFITHYPEEVFWAPLWKIWHYCWTNLNGFGSWKSSR